MATQELEARAVPVANMFLENGKNNYEARFTDPLVCCERDSSPNSIYYLASVSPHYG
jgi:hypothetical protein